MYSQQLIQEIHSVLQALDPSALVLLGGSYLYSEAMEESDLDFYFIIPLRKWGWKNKYKKEIEKIRRQHPEVIFSVMLTPKIFGKTWLYYIYGKDCTGNIHTFFPNKKLLLINCFKLAYFNYLSFLSIPHNKLRNLLKIAKQLTTAIILTRKNTTPDDCLFSWRWINANRAYLDPEDQPLVSQVIQASPLSPTEFQQLADSVYRILKKNLASCLHPPFSVYNYLLYNLKFVPHGQTLFIFQNPDKLVMQKMISGLMKKDRLGELYEEIKKIIFPVIII